MRVYTAGVRCPDGKGLVVRRAAVVVGGIFVISGLVVLAVPGEAAWPGSNGRILYYDQNNPGIWVMDAHGSNREQLTTNDDDLFASWSPDGSKIVFQRGFGDAGVWTMDPDGDNPELIGEGQTPSWSNDGSRIVFSRDGLIMTMAAGGGDEQTVTKDSNVEDLYPVYQPGTEVLAIVRTPVSGVASASGGNPTSDILLMDFEGDVVPVTTTPGYYEGAPDWSPDGQTLVFRGEAGDIHKWDSSAPGMTTRILESNGDVLDWPAFSPDGNLIAFSKGPPVVFPPIGAQGVPPQNSSIWVMNDDGTGASLIPGGPADPMELAADWGVPSPLVTPTPKPTDAPTASPTPSETPGPTPIEREVVWGDYQCDTAADPVDSLIGLRFDASLGVNLNGCPPLGTTVDILTNAAVVAAGAEVPWGDVDCDAALNPVDSLKILRYDAALEVEQEEDCALIGSEVMIRYTP